MNQPIDIEGRERDGLRLYAYRVIGHG